MRWLAAGLAAAVAVAAAGCGGGGGSKRLSKDEFIAKADAACSTFDTAQKQISFPQVDPTSPTTSSADLAKFGDPLAATADLARQEVKELRALAPPKDFQSSYDGVLSDLDAAVSKLDEASKAAKSGDRAALSSALEDSQTHADAANKVAVSYGLKVCGAG